MWSKSLTWRRNNALFVYHHQKHMRGDAEI